MSLLSNQEFIVLPLSFLFIFPVLYFLLSSVAKSKNNSSDHYILTLLHSEWPKLCKVLAIPKLYGVLAILSAIGLTQNTCTVKIRKRALFSVLATH